MNANVIRNRISELCSHVIFDYNGKQCGVDPISRTQFDMWYGDKTETVKNIDEVMGSPFFDGKTLEDISQDIQNVEL